MSIADYCCTCVHYPYGPAENCPWCENIKLRSKCELLESRLRDVERALNLPFYADVFKEDKNDN